jgi:DNA invertase Pin-like site-specific DNA recombinase
MNVAIYLRVSTERAKDSTKSVKGQDPTNQLIKLEEMAKGRQWNIVRQYVDYDSAAKLDRSSQQFTKMMEAASKHEFDAILVWSLDRFSREGARKVASYMDRLEHWKVGFVSYTEQWLDTLGPWKDMVLSMLATIAKQESQRISERVKAGIERVRRTNGNCWGRNRHKVKAEEVAAMRERGCSWRAIATKMGCSEGTAVARYLEATPDWVSVPQKTHAKKSLTVTVSAISA